MNDEENKIKPNKQIFSMQLIENIKKMNIYIIIVVFLVVILGFFILFVDLNKKIINLNHIINSIYNDESADDLQIDPPTEQEYENQVQVSDELISKDIKADLAVNDQKKSPDTIANVKKLQNHSNIINCKDYIELLLAVFELQNKLMQGESFQKELITIEIKSVNDKKIIELLRGLDLYAESGVPDIENLKEEFNSIENDLILAYWVDNHKKNWKMYLRKILSKLVFIKKVGQRAIRAGGIEMIIENVNEALESDDLENAILYVKKVEGDVPRSIISLWLEHVNNYIDAREKVRVLNEYVTSKQNCLLKSQPN